jgi:hypothetical protein
MHREIHGSSFKPTREGRRGKNQKSERGRPVEGLKKREGGYVGGVEGAWKGKEKGKGGKGRGRGRTGEASDLRIRSKVDRMRKLFSCIRCPRVALVSCRDGDVVERRRSSQKASRALSRFWKGLAANHQQPFAPTTTSSPPTPTHPQALTVSE